MSHVEGLPWIHSSWCQVQYHGPFSLHRIPCFSPPALNGCKQATCHLYEIISIIIIIYYYFFSLILRRDATLWAIRRTENEIFISYDSSFNSFEVIESQLFLKKKKIEDLLNFKYWVSPIRYEDLNKRSYHKSIVVFSFVKTSQVLLITMHCKWEHSTHTHTHFTKAFSTKLVKLLWSLGFYIHVYKLLARANLHIHTHINNHIHTFVSISM